jgi:hypothetical protein
MKTSCYCFPNSLAGVWIRAPPMRLLLVSKPATRGPCRQLLGTPLLIRSGCSRHAHGIGPLRPASTRGRRCNAAKGLSCTAMLTSSTDETLPERARHHPVLDGINEATKWAVSAAAFGTLLLRRDVAACWCLTGSVVAAFNCKVSLPGKARNGLKGLLVLPGPQGCLGGVGV